MAWRPSKDRRYSKSAANSFWDAIETAYDSACAMTSLGRRDDASLDRDYVHSRKGDAGHDSSAMVSRLRPEFRSFRLGPADIDLIDFFVNYRHDRVLNILGFRGSGKTTLLHYVESIMRRALPDTHPVLLMVDCLPLNDQATPEDFVKRLELELQTSLDFAPTSFRGAIASAVSSLSHSPSYVGAQGALLQLIRDLPDEARSRPIVVLDNLDHLSLSTVGMALDLVRGLAVGTGVSCATCLRPGSLTGVLGRGDAQAFFGLQLQISPPEVSEWLASLATRVAAAGAAAGESNPSVSLIAYGRRLHPEDVRQALLRFNTLLQGRRADDDPIGFLDALSADDMRHLVKLVRRMLSHRDLPGQGLLGIREETPFHPLPAMFEGQRTLYSEDEFVPNVLLHESRNGPPDFLLPHRILTLLNEYGAVPTYRLVDWLELLEVERVDAITCLDRLYRSLLIRCSNAESIDMSRALPGDVSLTGAGSHYVNHVFSLSDYLLTAIVDVPLRHVALIEAIRQGAPEDAFPPRLASLLEYTEEVRVAEERQLQLLNRLRAGSAPRRLADALRRGGLMSRALERGLRDVAARNRGSSNSRVKALVVELEVTLPKLESWWRGAEKRLSFIMNRTNRRPRLEPRVAPLTENDTELSMQLRPVGEDLSVEIDVRAPSVTGPLVVVLGGETPSSSFLSAVIPGPKPRAWPRGFSDSPPGARGTLRGTLPAVPGGASSSWELGGLGIELGRSIRGKLRGVLLVSEEPDDCQQVRLFVEGHDVPHELGPSHRSEPVRELARRLLSRVGERIVDGDDVSDDISAAGMALRERTLHHDGWNLLRGILSLVDTILVIARGANLSVPWEWLCDDPANGGDSARLIRWPGDPVGGALHLRRIVEPPSPARTLATYGLPCDHSSRKPTPTSCRLLAKEACADVVHVVAHCPGERLDVGPLRLEIPMLRTFPLAFAGSVVLSACGVGVHAEGRNFAAAIAEGAACPVWAPLVDIRQDQASAVDDALRLLVAGPAPASSLDELMSGRKNGLAILRTYVQYGTVRKD